MMPLGFHSSEFNGTLVVNLKSQLSKGYAQYGKSHQPPGERCNVKALHPTGSNIKEAVASVLRMAE
eukprot:1156935-Pelagomonas_calceolata.AAC.3